MNSEFWKLSEDSNFNQIAEKLELPYPNIKTAGKNICQLLGFNPLNEVDKVDKTAKKYEFLFAYASLYDSLV